MSRVSRGMVAAVLGASIAAFASTPASAAIIQPSSAHSVNVSLNAKGDPVPFTLEASGYQPGEPVYVEVCDGEPEGVGLWSPTSDCDETTSGAAVQAGSNGDVIFPVGGQSEVLLFRGASPDQRFNCLAAADIKKGAAPATGMGNVVPLAKAVYPAAGATAYDSNQPTPHVADPSIPSWDDCQLGSRRRTRQPRPTSNSSRSVWAATSSSRSRARGRDRPLLLRPSRLWGSQSWSSPGGCCTPAGVETLA
jgi:hypothetical protein